MGAEPGGYQPQDQAAQRFNMVQGPIRQNALTCSRTSHYAPDNSMIPTRCATIADPVTAEEDAIFSQHAFIASEKPMSSNRMKPPDFIIRLRMSYCKRTAFGVWIASINAMSTVSS